jgi:hypothetical protein
MGVTQKKAAAMKKPSIGTRAWRLLRLAVLWARRGSAAHILRLLRALRRHERRGDRLRYGEREYSIDETPAFRFRTPSARVLRLIPCIASHVPDTPGLYYGDDRYFFSDALRGNKDDEDGARSCYYGYGGADNAESICPDESQCADEEQLLEHAMAEARHASTATPGEGAEDAGVDVKAEEFIARFYAQMKLQRQVSWLKYNEMMQRSVN